MNDLNGAESIVFGVICGLTAAVLVLWLVPKSHRWLKWQIHARQMRKALMEEKAKREKE